MLKNSSSNDSRNKILPENSYNNFKNNQDKFSLINEL